MEVVDQATHWRTVGGTLLGRGLLFAAREAFLAWLETERRCGEPERMIRPLNALATVKIRRKEYAAAVQWLLQAQVLARTHAADADQHLRIHHNLLVCYAEQNEMAAASAQADRIHELLAAAVDEGVVATTWSTLTYFYGRLRDWQKTTAAAAVGLEKNRALGTPAVGLCLLNLAIAQASMGESRAAEANLREAIEAFHAQGDEVMTAYPHTELGWIAFQRGDCAGALEEGEAALQRLLRQVKAADKEEVGRISWLFGSVFATWGERNAALKYLNRAAAYFAQCGSHADWQEVSRRIGEVLSRPLRPVAGAPARPYLKQLDQLTGILDLIDDLESVAPDLRGHTERVAALALVLGEAVGLSAQELTDLHHAALLHDVGLVAIDSAVLDKPEDDLPETHREMRQLHPALGAQMLAPFGFSATVTTAVRHHHERYDGTGYPQGLAGQEIPLLSRIISILECYDAALTRNKPPTTHEVALDAVMRQAGSRFDPFLCQRFAELFVVPADTE